LSILKPYYEEDGIQIYHGDCREILPLLPKVDLILTDPPYGLSFATNRGFATWDKTQIAHDSSTELRDFIIAYFKDTPQVIFGSWKIQRPTNLRGVLIWDKGPASGMGDLTFPWKPSWEEIYVSGDGFEGKRTEGVLKGFTITTWESVDRYHPNSKPVSLIKHLIEKTVAETILDPFMGSGTTLRAAKDLGRKAIGIEIEEKYCEIAAKRMAQEVLQFG
jgi:DNA modification methylase